MYTESPAVTTLEPERAGHMPVADPTLLRPEQVPPLDHDECARLATAILDRFMVLLDSLEADEWLQPTYCSEWRVREIVAHEAGGYASCTSIGSFLRTWMGRLPKPGHSLLDETNAWMVRTRTGRTTDELMAELRDVGPRAIAARHGLPASVRGIPLPGAPMGIPYVGYLTDDVYLRDTWVHTIDVCHATGRPVPASADLDGRIVALLVRDLATRQARLLGGQSIVWDLQGVGGAAYQVGAGADAAATIRMSIVDFALRTSERITADEALERSQITGDPVLARLAVQESFILY